jgi:cyclohexanecarboxylate-CoA ligase
MISKETASMPDGRGPLLEGELDAVVAAAGTYVELLESRLGESPGAPMLYDGTGAELTFGQFAWRVGEMAGQLSGLGVGPESTVSWQMPNVADAFVVFMALSFLGARQSPLLAAFRERELSAVLGSARPEIVVVPATWRGTDHVALAARVIGILGLATEIVPIEQLSGRGSSPDPTRAPAGAARYLYATSGSTGSPKLVLHTDRSLLAGSLAQGRLLGFEPSDVNVMVASVAHIGGPVALAQSLAHGNAVVLMDAFEPEASATVMRSRGVTTVSATPATLVSLVEEQRRRPQERLLPRLRLCISGAAPKPPALHREIRELLGGRGLMMGYGMTETGSIGVPAPEDSDEQLEHTVGRVMPGMEIQIIDPAGQPAGIGGTGEIRVRGPMVCERYLDEEQTRAAFDDEGWIITGDLGQLRRDGHLCITGRIKDLIIRKGENISPTEIEDVLYGMPGVAEVAVIGRPDPLLGERVCVVVAPAAGAEAPSLEQIVDRCRRLGLMTQKFPQEMLVHDRLPRTALGKIDRAWLRRIADSPVAAGGIE